MSFFSIWAWRDSNSHALALVPKTSVSTIPPHAHIQFSKVLLEQFLNYLKQS